LQVILRVYAMWNRSKRILWVLLFIYVPQVVVSFIITGIRDNLNTYLSITITRVMDVIICNVSWINTPSLLDVYTEIPRFVLGAALLVLAVTPTMKESAEMYKATRQWQ
ncbi:hypothetical protein J3R83DRAFT_13964, partial [Lanmaoa asiatica]